MCRVNTSLTNVDLSVNSISDAGAVALAKVLSSCNRSVRLLDLSHNFIGQRGISSFVVVPRKYDGNDFIGVRLTRTGWHPSSESKYSRASNRQPAQVRRRDI